MNLKNNTILITGGSSGIGLAFARRFVALGNMVIVTGRNQDKLERVQEEIPELITLQADVSDPKAIARLAERVTRDYPELNVVMNNAGVFQFRNLADGSQDLSELTSEVDINVSGAIRTVAAFVDLLKQNRGTVINVSSGLAYVPLVASPVYSATKAALHSYTVSLRAQLAPHGVEVIELMPPAVKTEMTAELPEDGGFKVISTDKLVEATMQGIQDGREEIRPGQSNQLHWMSRIAPRFINREIARSSSELIPQMA